MKIEYEFANKWISACDDKRETHTVVHSDARLLKRHLGQRQSCPPQLPPALVSPLEKSHKRGGITVSHKAKKLQGEEINDGKGFPGMRAGGMENKPVRGESEVPSLAMGRRCYESIRGEKAERNMEGAREEIQKEIGNLAVILVDHRSRECSWKRESSKGIGKVAKPEIQQQRCFKFTISLVSHGRAHAKFIKRLLQVPLTNTKQNRDTPGSLSPSLSFSFGNIL